MKTKKGMVLGDCDCARRAPVLELLFTPRSRIDLQGPSCFSIERSDVGTRRHKILQPRTNDIIRSVPAGALKILRRLLGFGLRGKRG